MSDYIQRIYAYFQPNQPRPTFVSYNPPTDDTWDKAGGRVKTFICATEQRYIDQILSTLDLVYPRPRYAKVGDEVIFDNYLVPASSDQEAEYQRVGLVMGKHYRVRSVERHKDGSAFKISLAGLGEVKFPIQLFSLFTQQP